MKALSLIETLEDLKGCTLVHLDVERRLAVFWNGSMAFLEYHVGSDGLLRQGDAWTAERRPKSVQDALAESLRRYGL